MSERIFKRKIYEKMLRWKEESNGKTGLLIKGARRVGKSTIVEEFAKKEYETYILIDFSNTSREISQLFDDMSDLNYFFLRLQLLFNTDLHERNSVIIFDEVQLQPLARQAIKHLVKDGRYDYIETGSLISIKKNIKDILIPSEETRLTMYPMDHEEFRWALDDKTTVGLIRTAFENGVSLGNEVHRKLMRDFRLYMLVGGMPQAVNEYIDTNNFSKVDIVKRNILELYEDDFRKLDPSGSLTALFDAIPAQLSKNASRYRASSIDPRIKSKRASNYIADMVDSLTVNIAYHADDPNVGMSLTKDINRYKLFLSDTGLFVTLAFKDKDFTENIIYEKLLSDKIATNLGYVYENAVAQMLQTAGNELFYYTFLNGISNHSYEIDFILSRGSKICPVEVKSSGYRTHASIDAFSQKYSKRVREKYLIYTKDMQREKDIMMIPAYMTPFI